MNGIRRFRRFGSGRFAVCLFFAAALAARGRPADGAEATEVKAPDATIHANRPYAVEFAPRQARFVRILIQRSSNGQPCIDELEIYGRDAKVNLGLASGGAKATASSCLTGYPIHQIAHLNDGKYGNSNSWIAAGTSNEWAQIELPGATEISRVVISRDRQGKYHDRVPVAFEICLSADCDEWQTVCHVEAKAAVPVRRGPQYAGPFKLGEEATWQEKLAYAFNCERHTWNRMSTDDHLSPLVTERPAMPGGEPYWGRIAKLDALSRTLVQMEEMIARLAEKGLTLTEERRQLADLRRRQAVLDAAENGEAAAESLYHEARLAKRSLMFRDPDLDGLQRILFVKRHPYHSSHNYSDILDSKFQSGGGVCLLEIPRVADRLEPAQAKLTTLFDAADGIAREPVPDFDAEKIYFAYRPAKNPNPAWQPYWHLMAVNSDGSGLEQLTDGPFHDYYPCPLPDGDLAFISTRVKARFLCWRPQAFVLFRMKADGSNIRQLSSANISEWTPSVMHDGRILWTRSEYLDKGADFGHTLWAIHPDGTHPELIFGNNTPNCYINGREVSGRREILCTLFSHGGDHNGPIGLIDRGLGPFDSRAVTNITPDITPHYNMNWPRYECFRDPVPVTSDYFLVSHAPGDRFGLYVIDRYGNRELLHIDPSIGSMCPVPLRPSARPPVLPPLEDSQLARANSGRLTLVDVYQGLGPDVKRGQVKYLRICQEVQAKLIEMPDGQCQSDHQSFQDWYASPTHKVRGPHGWPTYVAKGTFGLVPVGEDGSVAFDVPAGKVLYFEVLDEEFNELQRMRSVVQLQPGEKRSCIGCHENRQSTPIPQRSIATSQPAVKPTPPPWGVGAFSYERAVQPVLDAHCVRCHDASDKQGINLAGTLDADKIPVSYRTLITGGWVHYFDFTWNLRHHKAQPMTFGTLKSELPRFMGPEHYDVKLTEPQMRAVKCWIDLNCPLWPDYQFRPDRIVSAGGG